MTKDLFIKLYDKLGRDPTDDEMADAMADKIDSALERFHENYDRTEKNTIDHFSIVWTKRKVRKCSHCGDETEEFCIIERGPPGQNWIEDIWVRLGYEGKPVCVECYYK